jgi:asparagine synthase (glutamine-hydrolysing)
LGAIIAISSLDGKRDVFSAATRMMKALVDRGDECFGIGTPDEAFALESQAQLSQQRISSPTVVGFNLKKIFPKELPQPLSNEKLRLVFEGRVFPTSQISDCAKALSKLEEVRLELPQFVKETDGAYATAVIRGGALLVARDLLGCKPLYWGEVNGRVAFASERKALWTIGIDSPHTFPPGAVASVDTGGHSIQRCNMQFSLVEQEIDLDSASKKLWELISNAIQKRTGDLKQVAVAYSGGLDSGILAHCSQAAGLDVELFTVTVKGNGELEDARKTAKELGLPHTERVYSLADVREAIPEVVRRIEKPNVMDVSIAIPLLWACQLAEENGFQVIFTGQGADELFGGYDRYITAFQRHGLKEANRMMFRDVLRLSELSLERDEQVSASMKTELRLPFVDQDLIRFVLSLPASLKIGGVEESRQKLVLRRVAKLQGIPGSIYERPKRAVQYSTGVDASIRLLARSAGLTPQTYLMETYNRIRKEIVERSNCEK